jgi:hypothetical protein
MLVGTALGLWLALAGGVALAGKAPPKPADEAPADGTCGSFGTSVNFVDTPVEAARQARKEEKLVFVLHVSGNFEDPRFT